MTGEEGRAHADIVKKEGGERIGKQFKVYSPAQTGSETKGVLLRKRARLVAKGYRGPAMWKGDLMDGNVDIAGCVCRRSSRLQLIPLSALKKWKIWSLRIKNASPVADGYDR